VPHILEMHDPLKAQWLGSTVRHEGFPLALRVRPDADSPANQKALPHLVALTHHLDQVRVDGLPEAAYDDGLALFDGVDLTRVRRQSRYAATFAAACCFSKSIGLT
jgi:hypothetical protein